MIKGIIQTFRKQYPLYLIEAAGLGFFMVSACLFTILLEHPDFKLIHLIPSPFVRRFLIGVAMGTTAMVIIYSPMGKRSGAHINPSITLTMLLLRKISVTDVLFYILFQIMGGITGVLIVKLLFPSYLADPSIAYIATVPGKEGIINATIGESLIAFIMMFTTLITSNIERTKNLTGVIAGILIVCFVTFEAPFSGFSMNPARTLASAIPSGIWDFWYMYMVVPPVCMILAALIYNLLFFKGEFNYLKHDLNPKPTVDTK